MKDRKDKKIILIDGNSLLYRAFFALPTTIALPSGQAVNGVYGFTSMLLRLFTDEQPDIAAVAFDSKAATFRHQQFADYKSQRQETPAELISQFSLVRDVLTAMDIPYFELDGYEADDILATLARQSEKKGDETIVVTGDRDAFQLIDEHTKVMTTRKGISDIVIYDREKVISRYGVPPEKIPDFLGLKGDASDNIPGVPGVGDKTAAKLLQNFADIEDIYDRLDEVKPERLQNLLANNKEAALLSKKLATLHFAVPLDVDLNNYKFGSWDEDRVRQVFSNLKFKSLLERFLKNLAGKNEETTIPPPLKVRTITAQNSGELKGLLSALDDLNNLGWRFVKNKTIYFALAGQEKDGFIAIVMDTGGNPGEEQKIIRVIKEFLEKNRCSSATNSTFDLKNQVPLLKVLGLEPAFINFDVALAAYLLEATSGNFDAETLAAKYLDRSLPDPDNKLERLGAEAAAAAALAPKLSSLLTKLKQDKLFKEVEMELILSLARMEEAGVGLDIDYLNSMSAKMSAEINDISKRIFTLADEEFNLNSPQQLSQILFEKLELKPGKKTKSKTAFATGAAVLSKMIDAHPIVPLIIKYRELAKLKSTYIDSLPPLINKNTGRLHTTFNQMVTATGRLSSSSPNIQNIPIRTSLGRQIRKAFIPAHEGEKLLTGDYSQIELRLMAHLSGDANLIKLFTDEVDIHQATAAEVFGLQPEQVTKALRRKAKAINFGIIYGISPFGLAEQLNITTQEAKSYIDKYLERYPDVKKFIKETVSKGYKDGFVTTILGRRRYIPELKSTNYQIRSFGERVAANAPLQGSAADIIKIAMINIDCRLQKEGLQTRMVMQVHDELVFEVPPLEETATHTLIEEEMEGAFKLRVRLKVELAYGPNWGETQ